MLFGTDSSPMAKLRVCTGAYTAYEYSKVRVLQMGAMALPGFTFRNSQLGLLIDTCFPLLPAGRQLKVRNWSDIHTEDGGNR